MFSFKYVKDHFKRNEVNSATRSLAGPIFAGIVFSFFISLCMLVVPIYMLSIYDKVLASRSVDTLLALTFLAVGLLFALAVLEAVRSRLLLGMGRKMDGILAGRVFEAVFACTLNRPERNATKALNDLSTVRQFVASKSMVSYFDAPWAPIFLVILFAIDLVIGVVTLVGLLIIMVLAVVNDYVSKQPTIEGASKQYEANRIVEKSIGNIDVLISMGMMGRLKQKWLETYGHAADLQSTATSRSESVEAVISAMRFAVQISVLGTAAYLAITDQISPGLIIASNLIAMRTVAPFEQVIKSWGHFLRSRDSLRRIDDLLTSFPPDTKSLAIPPSKGKLEVVKLSFAPNRSSPPILRNITLNLDAGETLGVIGPSGAGKSTFGRLLVGAIVPRGGVIRWDGFDTAQWDMDTVGPFVGYLPQDIELFSGTIAENICRFSEAEPERIVDTALLANAHEMIQRLPDGYETFIGEGGVRLSGGQRQRIGLARALFGDPTIVVLDEPNSSLDIEGIAALNSTLSTLKERGKTVVVISHSPQVLRQMDKVVMLSNGIVEKFGPSVDVLPAIVPGLKKVPAKRPAVKEQKVIDGPELG